jgi:hypothetical protein
MDSKTQVKVWFSADGYRDPDDNLATLIGGAQIKAASSASGRVTVGGYVFGDTKDGGQYYTLHPGGSAPSSFGNDSRYSSVAGNKQAAGNYAFYKEYGKAALKDLSSGWKQFDLLASDNGGKRPWNFDANKLSQISGASQALANDIISAISKGNAAVVYSAGGGANVPAEAIGYMLNKGYKESAIASHFAVIQHGRSNWEKNYEPEARGLTREYTIAISNQNMAKYTNGTKGPDLKHAIVNKGAIDGSAWGSKFDKALDVAIGAKGFGSLSNATFKTTADASDAGSHAFAVDLDDLQSAWNKKMRDGESLPSGDSWAHRIKGEDGGRLRVHYNEFNSKKIANLLDGDKSPNASASASASAETGTDNGSTGTGTTTGTGSTDTGVSSGSTDRGVSPGAAPFVTSGTPLAHGEASLYGLAVGGAAAEIVVSGGKIGVGAAGDANTVDHAGSGSEAIGFDFGGEADEIVFKLAGLSSKGGAHEAAKLTVYDADGDVLDSYLFTRNGTHAVDLDDGAHYAKLEAADWVVASDSAPSGDPDFALVSFQLDYV